MKYQRLARHDEAVVQRVAGRIEPPILKLREIVEEERKVAVFGLGTQAVLEVPADLAVFSRHVRSVWPDRLDHAKAESAENDGRTGWPIVPKPRVMSSSDGTKTGAVMFSSLDASSVGPTGGRPIVPKPREMSSSDEGCAAATAKMGWPGAKIGAAAARSGGWLSEARSFGTSPWARRALLIAQRRRAAPSVPERSGRRQGRPRPAAMQKGRAEPCLCSARHRQKGTSRA